MGSNPTPSVGLTRAARNEIETRIETILDESLPSVVSYDQLSPHSQATLLRTWQRMHSSQGGDRQVAQGGRRQDGVVRSGEQQIQAAAATRLGRAIGSLLGSVADEGEAMRQLSLVTIGFLPEQLEDTIALGCQAVLALLPYSRVAPESVE